MKNTTTRIFNKNGQQIYQKSIIDGKVFESTTLLDKANNTLHYNDSDGYSKFIKYDESEREVLKIKEKYGKVILAENVDEFDEFGHIIKGRLFSEDFERNTSYADYGNGRIVYVDMHSAANTNKNYMIVNIYSKTGKLVKILEFDDKPTTEILKAVYEDIDSVKCAKSTIYEYDDLDRLIHTKSSMLINNFEEWFEYTENGSKTHYIDDYIESWTECDKNGNEIHYKNAIGEEEFNVYNDKNELIRKSDNYGQVTIYEPFSDEELKLFKDNDIGISLILDTRYKIYDNDKNLISYCNITYNVDTRTLTIEHFSMPDEKIIDEYVYNADGTIKSESSCNGTVLVFYSYIDNVKTEVAITTSKNNNKTVTRKKVTNFTDIDIVETEFESDC